MVNQTGIAITIKAFLPTGKTLDEMFTALGIVKVAHESGDYSALLKAASVDEVKTEQKTRRVEEAPQPPAASESNNQSNETLDGANVHGLGPDVGSGQNPDYVPEAENGNSETVADDASAAGEEAVPEFIKKGKSKAA